EQDRTKSNVYILDNTSTLPAETDSLGPLNSYRKFTRHIASMCPTLFNSRFTPTPWLNGAHLQSIWSGLMRHGAEKVDYVREYVMTPDQGLLGLDWYPSKPCERECRTPTLFVLHGVSGGSHDSYVRSFVHQAYHKYGYRCVVMNFRGCNNTPILTPELYCPASTSDVRAAVTHVKQKLPNAPTIAVGFSLGSNFLVNYLGELGSESDAAAKKGIPFEHPFVAAVSVGNPWDLGTTIKEISAGLATRPLTYLFYNTFMMVSLKTQILA
ncbi:hypothetical protein HK102_007115, partial [Quaeritorhiza haematococci]